MDRIIVKRLVYHREFREKSTQLGPLLYGDTYAPKPRGNSLPTKDNRTWVADQEPVNMKRLEPWNRLTICA